jgi:hypothetical protein
MSICCFAPVWKERVEDETDKKCHQYDRDAEIVEPDCLIEKNKKIEDRPIEYLLVKIDHEFLFLLCDDQCFCDLLSELFFSKAADVWRDHHKDIISAAARRTISARACRFQKFLFTAVLLTETPTTTPIRVAL